MARKGAEPEAKSATRKIPTIKAEASSLTPKEICEVVRLLAEHEQIQKTLPAGSLARAFAGFMLFLNRPSSVEVSRERRRGTSKLLLREEYDELCNLVQSFYRDMENEYQMRHGAPPEPETHVPDWEQWTIALWERLRGFFAGSDLSRNPPPIRRRPEVPYELLDLLSPETDVLAQRLKVEAKRLAGREERRIRQELFSGSITDWHMMTARRALWRSTPKGSHPPAFRDRRVVRIAARFLLASKYPRVNPETIRKYLRKYL